MPLVAAKCTQCGAELQVDSSHEAAVCQHCGTPFIVEKAINNYNTYVTQNFAGANVTIQGANIDSYIERAFMFLEEKKWESAYQYAEKSLDIEPKCTKAYIIKYMVKNRISKIGFIVEQIDNPSSDYEFSKALKFDDGTAKEILNKWYQDKYKKAVSFMNQQNSKEGYLEASKKFSAIRNYQDASEKYAECLSYIEKCRIDEIIEEADKYKNNRHVDVLQGLLRKLDTVNDSRSDELKIIITNNIDKLKRKNTRILAIAGCVVAIGVVLYAGATSIVKATNTEKSYNEALELYESSSYYAAFSRFEELGDYKDSSQLAKSSLELYYKELDEETTEQKISDLISKFKSSVDNMDYDNAKEQYISLMEIVTTDDEIQNKEIIQLYDWVYSLIESYYGKEDWSHCVALGEICYGNNDKIDKVYKQAVEIHQEQQKSIEGEVVHSQTSDAPKELYKVKNMLLEEAEWLGAEINKDGQLYIRIIEKNGEPIEYPYIEAVHNGEPVEYMLHRYNGMFEIVERKKDESLQTEDQEISVNLIYTSTYPIPKDYLDIEKEIIKIAKSDGAEIDEKDRLSISHMKNSKTYSIHATKNGEYALYDLVPEGDHFVVLRY